MGRTVLHLVPHRNLAEEADRQERAERTLGILSTITQNTDLIADKIRSATNDQLTQINNAVLQVRAAKRGTDETVHAVAIIALFQALNFSQEG